METNSSRLGRNPFAQSTPPRAVEMLQDAISQDAPVVAPTPVREKLGELLFIDLPAKALVLGVKSLIAAHVFFSNKDGNA